jgi:hypothetical protein
VSGINRLPVGVVAIGHYMDNEMALPGNTIAKAINYQQEGQN